MIVYDSLADLTRLIAAFADGTLPTHQAHLIGGLWYCSQHDTTAATEILRDSIKRYNVSCGKKKTDTSGYHETITRFFMWYIKRYLDKVEPHHSFIEIVNDFCAQHIARSSPLKFYSQERLMSVAARLSWVAPDLQALD